MPLREPSRPNELTRLFTNLVCPNEPMHSSTFMSLGTTAPQPWCAPHVDAPQPLWCDPSLGRFHPMLHLMFGQAPWCVRVPNVPTCPTSATLGCRSNPKFPLLPCNFELTTSTMSQLKSIILIK